jgi:hypothetical protein
MARASSALFSPLLAIQPPAAPGERAHVTHPSTTKKPTFFSTPADVCNSTYGLGFRTECETAPSSVEPSFKGFVRGGFIGATMKPAMRKQVAHSTEEKESVRKRPRLHSNT